MKLTVDGKTVEELIVDKTATIGEKLSFRRFEVVTKEDSQVFGTYSHMGGKIIALTVLSLIPVVRCGRLRYLLR